MPRQQPLRRISAAEARRWVMALQGLADAPDRPGNHSPGALAKLIRRMGFVQIDTISTVGRAHHLTLSSRITRFDPKSLEALAGPKQQLFEHWTHDASYIPTEFFAHWRHRFARAVGRSWHRSQLGADGERVIAMVRDRIANEGPLRSKDFEHTRNGAAGNWWNWMPAKLALDYLWRAGELYIVSREGFQKIYDLTERAAPHLLAQPSPTLSAHVDWACTSALERLGFASVNELWKFWNHISASAARKWVVEAIQSGRVVEVEIESLNGEPPRRAVALPEVLQRAKSLPEAPPIARLLCPFDPVIRDRARLHRLFNFDYRFEAFVPAPKRVYGYYVMPLLAGDRLVGRVDPKFHRDTGVLEIKKVWWEPNSGNARTRRRLLDESTARLAAAVGATRVRMEA
ncbi:MAG TPA: crosslink repair DNA glycosylase YcaQ family protein [Tepidisphaeraceae bacterium]|nr:crosslink repair DNA glycosylase YcaQ family protein [Tepidisphaeraceae bacterium]